MLLNLSCVKGSAYLSEKITFFLVSVLWRAHEFLCVREKRLVLQIVIILKSIARTI